MCFTKRTLTMNKNVCLTIIIALITLLIGSICLVIVMLLYSNEASIDDYDHINAVNIEQLLNNINIDNNNSNNNNWDERELLKTANDGDRNDWNENSWHNDQQYDDSNRRFYSVQSSENNLFDIRDQNVSQIEWDRRERVKQVINKKKMIIKILFGMKIEKLKFQTTTMKIFTIPIILKTSKLIVDDVFVQLLKKSFFLLSFFSVDF